MNVETITDALYKTVFIAIEIALPFLLLALVTGLLVALLQSATRLQEMTLVFVPKILIIAFALTLLFPWILKIMTKFTHAIFIDAWDKVVESIIYVH